MTTSELTAQIIECEKRLYAAMLASDVRQLDQLIADDLVFVDQSGQLVSKAMDLETHRSGVLKILHLELLEQEIRCLENAAVAVLKISLAGTYQGVHFGGNFRYTRVWQLKETGWQIVAGHFNAIS